MKNKKLVPKLRFNGFGEEWKTFKLGDIITLMQSGLSRQLSVEDIGVPVLRSNNIVNGHIDLTDIKYWYLKDTKGATTENYFLKKNDLLVNFINSIGKMGKSSVYNNELKRPAIFTTNLMRLNFKDNINTYFIYYFFNTSYYKNYIDKITKPAVNQASFTTKDFKKMEIPIPNLHEQEKIAYFLKTIDKKIDLLKNMYEKYADFKKYLMQQIFAQKLRFDFTEEWDYLSVEDIFKSVSPKKYQIKSAEIKEYGDFEVIDQGQDEIAGYFNDKTKLCYELPIIIYGDHTTFVKFRDKPFIVGADGVKLLSPKINAVPKYLFYALEHFNIKPEGYKRHFSIVKKVKLPIPDLKEQNEITNIFSNVDIKIKCTQKQLNETKEFKKGLLQQMFV